MNSKSFKSRLLILSVFFVSFLFFGGAVKYVQNASFNNNGSGVISITYIAETSEILRSNGVIGNLPFKQDKINEYFNSDVTKVTKAIVYKDKTDSTLTSVKVDINLTNLNKLNEAKAFNGVDASWVKSDSGMVFRWLFSPVHQKTNSISLYQITFIFENDLRSTTGVQTGKSVAYYVTSDKMNAGGAYFTATVNSDGITQNTFSGTEKENDIAKNTVSGTTKESGEKKMNSETKTTEKKTGVCALFGVELPLILLGGLLISNRLKKNKKK